MLFPVFVSLFAFQLRAQARFNFKGVETELIFPAQKASSQNNLALWH